MATLPLARWRLSTIEVIQADWKMQLEERA